MFLCVDETICNILKAGGELLSDYSMGFVFLVPF